MAHFDEWVTDPDITLAGLRRDFLSDLSLVGHPYLGAYHVFTTSGTTGEPAVLVHDRESWRVLHVVARLRARRSMRTWHLMPTLMRRGLRSAVLFVTGGHFGAVVLTENVRRRSAVIARRVRVLSVLRPVGELVAELNEYQPTLLSAYPSALALLAEEQIAGRLRIRPLQAITAGETMTPAYRREIARAFRGCRVVEGYGASEVPALAVQCPTGSFHVNTDWYLFEPVDERYAPVPPGATSHTVLVTNLANRVQPLIRYDLGDRVEMATAPCPCGSVFPVVRVEGRTNDVLTFESGDGRHVRILPLALGAVVEETPGVRRFQAVGTGPRTLTLRLDLWEDAQPDEVWMAVEERVAGFLASHGAAEVSIERASEPPTADAHSGKFRQVWSA
jgi:phenylacetate-coenzyme A ligase PaaK-like adenylate-forming protein